jgi:hypothetical protein
MAEIHGIRVENYITGEDEDGKVEMDFSTLNEAINSSAECSVLNCTNRVAGDGECIPCFMGSLTGTTKWDDERKGYITTREES